MKILAIRQPWASLIVSGAKDIENRDWPTRYRGPFLIHPSQSKHGLRDSIAHVRKYHGIEIDPAKLQFGGIIGRAEIADCVKRSDSPWFMGKFGFVLRHRASYRLFPTKACLAFVPHLPTYPRSI